MTKKEVAENYLVFLEKGEIDKVVSLFTEDGIVDSPLYGTQSAKVFYKSLANDTNSSKLVFDGLFYEDNSSRISLLFDYIWELKSNAIVQFKVVDILELTPENKIQKLTIIYDTIHSREALKELL